MNTMNISAVIITSCGIVIFLCVVAAIWYFILDKINDREMAKYRSGIKEDKAPTTYYYHITMTGKTKDGLLIKSRHSMELESMPTKEEIMKYFHNKLNHDIYYKDCTDFELASISNRG